MKIIFREYGNWEDQGDRSFRAVVSVFDDAGVPIYTCAGSTYPNPHKPKDANIRTIDAYGCVRSGVYAWKYGDQAHNGEPAININNNQPIDTIAPNPNQGGKLFADHVDIHSAWSETWRGSAGCLTIRKSAWHSFLDIIEGHCGELELNRTNNDEVYA